MVSSPSCHKCGRHPSLNWGFLSEEKKRIWSLNLPTSLTKNEAWFVMHVSSAKETGREEKTGPEGIKVEYEIGQGGQGASEPVLNSNG